MKGGCFAIVAAIILPSSSVAKAEPASQGRYYLNSPLGTSCGQWVQLRKSQPNSRLFYIRAWFLGYLSGLNSGIDQHPQNPDFLVNIDDNAIFAWLDNYCGSHPLDDLKTASHELLPDLGDRAKKNK
jgi:hypothetical protein